MGWRPFSCIGQSILLSMCSLETVSLSFLKQLKCEYINALTYFVLLIMLVILLQLVISFEKITIDMFKGKDKRAAIL